MTRTAVYGGVEAGGTKVVCAVGTGPDDVRDQITIGTTSPGDTLGQVIAFFRSQRATGCDITGIGIGSFGPLDLDPTSAGYGYITTTTKPGWADTDVAGIIRRGLGVPVWLDTDVNAAALGEHRWGAGRGLRNVAYVTVGTGVGVGFVVNGQTLPGLVHPAIEHLAVRRHRDDDYPGGCPYHGDCLEGLASGPALAARTGPSPVDLGADGGRLLAIEAWYLAQAVTTLVYVVSPERIIVGGGLSHLPGLLDAVRVTTLSLVNGALAAMELTKAIADYIVEPGLGDRSGVLGAIGLCVVGEESMRDP